jgi:hypothetical protein
MICMPVGNEYGIDGESAPGPHHLLLRSLPAVKEKGVRSMPYQDTGRVALGGRQRPGCTEEIDLQGFAAHIQFPR